MTERVALVVTGRLEFRGLAPALQRLFPDAEFFITPWLSEQDLKDSTSTCVDPARNTKAVAEGNVPAIDDLVGHLAANLCGREAADFSVLVEDLELVNRANISAARLRPTSSARRTWRRLSARTRSPG